MKQEYSAARVATLPLAVVASITTTSMPVSAGHDALECNVPQTFGPLFSLLHNLTELAFIFGVVLAVFGFIFAGTSFIVPGQDWNRRGKLAAKNTFIGLVILLSAHMVVAFLVGELGGVVCT